MKNEIKHLLVAASASLVSLDTHTASTVITVTDHLDPEETLTQLRSALIGLLVDQEEFSSILQDVDHAADNMTLLTTKFVAHDFDPLVVAEHKYTLDSGDSLVIKISEVQPEEVFCLYQLKLHLPLSTLNEEQQLKVANVSLPIYGDHASCKDISGELVSLCESAMPLVNAEYGSTLKALHAKLSEQKSYMNLLNSDVRRFKINGDLVVFTLRAVKNDGTPLEAPIDQKDYLHFKFFKLRGHVGISYIHELRDQTKEGREEAIQAAAKYFELSEEYTELLDVFTKANHELRGFTQAKPTYTTLPNDSVFSFHWTDNPQE